MDEHMPVGGLVAPINYNDSQALSDGNIDELRSACHDAAELCSPARPVTKIKFYRNTSNMGERLGLAQS